MKRKLMMLAPAFALLAMLGAGPAQAATSTVTVYAYGSAVAVVDGDDATWALVTGTLVDANKPLNLLNFQPGCTYLGATPYGYIADCAGVRNQYQTIGFAVTLNGGNDTFTADHAAGSVYVSGNMGADTITFKGTAGSINGNNGADTIYANDGVKQTIDCGKEDHATDIVYRDSLDKLNDCGNDIKR